MESTIFNIPFGFLVDSKQHASGLANCCCFKLRMSEKINK